MRTDSPTKPWTVITRALASGLIGAALYASLHVFVVSFPSTALIDLGFALAVVPALGIRYGALAGLIAGTIGSACTHDLPSIGFSTFFSRDLPEGLVGVVAGVVGYFILGDVGPAQRVARVTASAMAGEIVGVAAKFSEFLVRSDFPFKVAAIYLPIFLINALLAVLFVPVADHLIAALVGYSWPGDEQALHGK
ncbi:hypothetical protein BRW65_07985 [Mycobacterium paraffinicum]|uniref:ECF transporter S component n=1 Tax=Mycobacterium paraffinicum TaxID=53378 RepID=A0A1Q4HY66_9MYCO|nr:hypothetical protein BRW65_07985 [Mycobacterium paraffinicum]